MKKENLIIELTKVPDEKTWLEFKHNNYDPDMIGEDISALANAAVLADRPCAYMIWGVENKTHKIVGTNHDLQNIKKGNEELDNWLRHQLSKNADFSFESVDITNEDGDLVKVGVLTIVPAVNTPVLFEKTDYIRVGSYTKKLVDYPALQARIWDKLRGNNFEMQTARNSVTGAEALALLQVSSYYDLLQQPTPASTKSILHDLCQDEILVAEDDGLYSITNLGALLLAKKLSDFKHLERKMLRIIQHKGVDRIQMLKEQPFDAGYAVCFERVEQYLTALLPSEERIGDDGIRRTVTAFPMLAIREALANMCIHQDMTIKGSSLLVEIFEDRIELTNPGCPLVDVFRIVDNPPRARNEKLAALMRRFHICEEAGTGWDKMVAECEFMNLPSPKIITYEEYTKVIVSHHLPFSCISLEDKIWACYLHACVQYLKQKPCTNTTIRNRFGLESTQKASVSRLIKACVKKGVIRPLDTSVAARYLTYIPVWA